MRIIAITLLMLTAGTLCAQTSEMELLQSYFNRERKAVIAEYMQLDASMEVAFWDVYNQYDAERTKLGSERIALIQDYGANFFNITDEKAQQWLDESFARRSAETKLRKKYAKLFVKATNPVVTLKFFQIEAYIGSVVEYQLMESLPFVGEEIGN